MQSENVWKDVRSGNNKQHHLRLLGSLYPTLGGIRTTLNHPCTSSHSHMPDADRRKMGVTPGMFRLSVGIEDVDDLIADFTQALEVFAK